MKNFGKIFLTIIASLLVLTVPLVIVWKLTSQNQDGETMNIKEARALMTKVCMAYSGVDDASRLSPAATIENYEYDSVQLSDTASQNLELLFMAKYALDYSDGSEGYLKSLAKDTGHDDVIYLAYKLLANGIAVDIVGFRDGEPAQRFAVQVLKGEKDTWQLGSYFIDVNNEIENYNHQVDNFGYLGFIGFSAAYGDGLKIKKAETISLRADQTIYGDVLTKESVTTFYYNCWDAIEHKKIYKEKTDYTDEEINQNVNTLQNRAKNVWSPKFYDIEFKETDILTLVAETMERISND